MPTKVEIATILDCKPEDAWQHVQTSALLHHVAAPLIRFLPRDRPFPEIWQQDEYRTWMLLFGIIPIGWQAVVISHPQAEPPIRIVRDNGYGPLVKQWDHWIEIRPFENGEKTEYLDRVTIAAGLLTPLIAAFARVFYAHRQTRWRSLASGNFAALKA